MQRKRGSKRRVARASRTKKPTDWLSYLEPIADEIAVAAEILRRLRWACALTEAPPGRRGRAQWVGEWMFEPYGEPRRRFSQIHDRLLAPEVMIERLSAADLEQLRQEWESEVREWAQAIWEKRGDTLRLRERRQDLRDGIEHTRMLDSTISEAVAARIHALAKAYPGKIIWRDARGRVGVTDPNEAEPPRGWTSLHWDSFMMSDEFGSFLDEDAPAEIYEELAEPVPEELDRTLARDRKGKHKKGRGGVHDIDPRLLSS